MQNNVCVAALQKTSYLALMQSEQSQQHLKAKGWTSQQG